MNISLRLVGITVTTHVGTYKTFLGTKPLRLQNLLLSPLVLTDAEFECLFPEVALTQSFHINYH